MLFCKSSFAVLNLKITMIIELYFSKCFCDVSAIFCIAEFLHYTVLEL